MWQISFVSARNCPGGMDTLDWLKSAGKRLKRGLNGLFEVQKETGAPLNPLIKDKNLSINKPR